MVKFTIDELELIKDIFVFYSDKDNIAKDELERSEKIIEKCSQGIPIVSRKEL